MWQIPTDGVPYHAPVAPVVPVAPQIPEGERIGSSLLGAFTHAAIARRQADLEQQKMVQDADLTARKLTLAEKAQNQDYDLKKMYYGILQENADSLGEYRRTALGRTVDAATARLKAEQEQQKYQDTITENDNRFQQARSDLKIDDPKFQTDDPAGWISNVRELQHRFGTAQVGAVPDQLKGLQSQVDQIKVPFYPDASFDGKNFIHDSKTPSMVPLEQIIQQYQDPDLRDHVESGLIAAGHGSIAQTLKEKHWFKPDEVTLKPTLDTYGKKVLRKVDLNRGTPEVPPVLQRKDNVRVEKYGQGSGGSGKSVQEQSNDLNNEAPLPKGKTSLNFTPTRTDQTLQHARNALAANPGARDEIMRRLASMSINPSLLSA